MNTTNRQIHDRRAEPVFRFFARWAAPVQAVLLTTLFSGCNSRVEQAKEEKEEIFEQTYKIDPEASLSIRNPHGSIAIHGTETAELRL